jgi:predicted DsbA family dithiol-disulfide isomerase
LLYQEKLNMKVEIWSDIACPFCFIGKVNFETALRQFEHTDDVEVIWKSFQLAPDLNPVSGETIYDYLISSKGVTMAEAQQMTDHVTKLAEAANIKFNMDAVVLANTNRCHQFLHFAKHLGLQYEVKNSLLKAYFTDGLDVNDINTLLSIAHDLNMDVDACRIALEKNTHADDVARDIYEANQIGLRGVPLFVFDRKYAVSGAQPSNAFLDVLNKLSADIEA